MSLIHPLKFLETRQQREKDFYKKRFLYLDAGKRDRKARLNSHHLQESEARAGFRII